METAATTTPRREIVHKGQLQQKMCKKSGTLLRKKKNVYEDELWVVLCVHDGGTGGIPHLEWYGELHSIRDHHPLKVLDLLECQYVNVAIGEERCLVIGFVDKTRPILELSAPSVDERKQWVDTLTHTLRRLNCLNRDEQENGAQESAAGPRAENVYVAFAGRDNDEEIEVSDRPNYQMLPTTYATESNVTTENEEEPPHVPFSPNQVRGLTLMSGGTMPSTKRILCLKDPIPMVDKNCTTPSNHLISAPSTESTSTETTLKQLIGQSSVSQHSRKLAQGHEDEQNTVEVASETIAKFKSSRSSTSSMHEEMTEGEMPTKFDKTSDEDGPPVPPPLPPRTIKQSLSPGAPRVPTSPIPSSPPQKMYDELPQPSSVTRSQYDQLYSTNGLQAQYQQISRFSSDFSDQLSSCSCDRRQSTENPKFQSLPSAHYDQLHSPAQCDVLAAPHESSEHIFRESLSRSRRISFWLALLADHVAFVELGDKVWIAGWNPKFDTNLRDILNFGDEVETMNGVKLNKVRQLPEIYASVKPGVQIELVLRSIPTMQVFSLIKPSNPKRTMGIVLHRGKNKIASIEPRSLADVASLPATMPAYFFSPGGDTVKAVISQLNGIPLSPFARNDQFFTRLDKIPDGQPIHLTIHPSDFCAQLARQLKSQLRDWRRFVHEH